MAITEITAIIALIITVVMGLPEAILTIIKIRQELAKGKGKWPPHLRRPHSLRGLRQPLPHRHHHQNTSGPPNVAPAKPKKPVTWPKNPRLSRLRSRRNSGNPRNLRKPGRRRLGRRRQAYTCNPLTPSKTPGTKSAQQYRKPMRLRASSSPGPNLWVLRMKRWFWGTTRGRWLRGSTHPSTTPQSRVPFWKPPG